MKQRTPYRYAHVKRAGDSLRLSCMVIRSLLLMVLCVLVSCKDDMELAGEDRTKVELAFDVSSQQPMTRMDEAATVGEGRSILDLYLFPFDVRGKVGADAMPLSGSVANLSWESVPYHRLGNRSVDIPYGTASFLCYAKAGAYLGDDKFVNGALMSVLSDASTPSGITFSPVVIHEDVTVTDGDAPSTIAAYLTDIANALKTAGKEDAYQSLINEGRPIAASSTNVAKIAAWVVEEGITPSGTYATDYPASISLPDGAAVVKWSTARGKFEVQTEATTEANINSLNRFIYPPEPYYYANSRIKTSMNSMKEYYGRSNWADVLKEYENDDAVTDFGSRSVAIKEPLRYAVGCLQIGIVANRLLEDASGTTTFELVDGYFPLTGVFVSGQFEQTFDFTPNSTTKEGIIYDKNVAGQSMGAARTADVLLDDPKGYTHTLVLQSRDQTVVRFALEFENNSGRDFVGLDGIVRNGTKFYLVGTIDVPGGTTEGYKKRAFTKGYITQGTVRITSLRQAHTYLPDLLAPRLEIGVKLNTEWKQSTTTNVPI